MEHIGFILYTIMKLMQLIMGKVNIFRLHINS